MIERVQDLGIAPLEQKMPDEQGTYTDYWLSTYLPIEQSLTGQAPTGALFKQARSLSSFMSDVRRSVILGGEPSMAGRYPLLFDRPPGLQVTFKAWDKSLGNYNFLEGAQPDFLRAAGLLITRSCNPTSLDFVLDRDAGADKVYQSFSDLQPYYPVSELPVTDDLYLAASFTYKAALLEPDEARRVELLNVAEGMYRWVHDTPYTSVGIGYRQDAGEYSADIRYKLANMELASALASGDTALRNKAFIDMRSITKERLTALRGIINSTQWHVPRGKERPMRDRCGKVFAQYVSIEMRDAQLALNFMGRPSLYELRKALPHEDCTPAFGGRLAFRPSFDIVPTTTNGHSGTVAYPIQLKYSSRPKKEDDEVDKPYLPGLTILTAEGFDVGQIDAAAKILLADYANPKDLKSSREKQNSVTLPLQTMLLQSGTR